MKTSLIRLFVFSTLLFTSSLAIAQTTPASPATPVINQRQANQHQRIKNGERSGQLTSAESRRLKMREGKIRRDKKMAKADGVVTPQEKAKIKHEQRRTSRAIYKQKHDAQVK